MPDVPLLSDSVVLRAEHILLVEDNEINRELLRAQLEFLGFAVTMVTDARRAIEAASAMPYDLIFMDCQLPGMDGLDATRAIRSAERPGSRVPIIAVTANALPGYQETCTAAGMDGYLTKPILLDPLADVLRRWLPHERPVAHRQPADGNAAAGPRRRLVDILGEDTERVEELLDLGAASVVADGTRLRTALGMRDAEAAGAAAHKLKGTSLELGLEALAGLAASAQAAITAGEWDAAQRAAGDATALIEAFVLSVREPRT